MHLLVGSGWFGLPTAVVKALVSQSSLPVFEMDKQVVETPYAHIRPLNRPSKSIEFSFWRLAHALKKADSARAPNLPELWLGTAGFVMENAHLFDWSTGQLRLKTGMSDHYVDFVRGSIAGRVAQGMALLLLEDDGYSFVSSFRDELRHNTRKERSKPIGLHQKKLPDFVFENGTRHRVLAEAKGRFVPPEGSPPIKGDLNAALKQLKGGSRLLSPQPSKCFAVGTYLREVSDSSVEQSLIAFVDPEADEPADPVEMPEDAIRRSNYASWLALMGFDDAAWHLRSRDGESQSRPVPIIALDGREYVVTIASIQPLSSLQLDYPPNGQDSPEWPRRYIGPFPDEISIGLIGLDLEVTRAIGMTIRGASVADGLMEIEPEDRRQDIWEIDGGMFHGSVLSDGSLFGEIRVPWKQWPTFEHKVVEF